MENQTWSIPKHKKFLDLLNAKGDQRHSHHQQVQEVEIVPAECSFMKKCSVCRHLWRRWRTLEDLMTERQTNTWAHLHFHSSEETDIHSTNISTSFLIEKTHAHIQRSPPCTRLHTFSALWFGVASSDQWDRRLNLPSPPPRPLPTWM